MTTYRGMFITRERRRAKSFEYTLAVDIDAHSPEEAKRLLDERWPNHQPLPHRYQVSIQPTICRQYSKFTRVRTTWTWNRYLPKPVH